MHKHKQGRTLLYPRSLQVVFDSIFTWIVTLKALWINLCKYNGI